jgi:hypothetical protein
LGFSTELPILSHPGPLALVNRGGRLEYSPRSKADLLARLSL